MELKNLLIELVDGKSVRLSEDTDKSGVFVMVDDGTSNVGVKLSYALIKVLSEGAASFKE